MSKIWEPYEILVYKDWIEVIINESSDELNEWEANFISSLYDRLNKGINLTQAQSNKLETIYAEKTK